MLSHAERQPCSHGESVCCHYPVKKPVGSKTPIGEGCEKLRQRSAFTPDGSAQGRALCHGMSGLEDFAAGFGEQEGGEGHGGVGYGGEEADGLA